MFPSLVWLYVYPYPAIWEMFKNPKVKKKKSSAPSFFTCVFVPVADLSPIKKKISADHVGRAYKSAIPRGR
jgi:hypothetical protein